MTVRIEEILWWELANVINNNKIQITKGLSFCNCVSVRGMTEKPVHQNKTLEVPHFNPSMNNT